MPAGYPYLAAMPLLAMPTMYAWDVLAEGGASGVSVDFERARRWLAVSLAESGSPVGIIRVAQHGSYLEYVYDDGPLWRVTRDWSTGAVTVRRCES